MEESLPPPDVEGNIFNQFDVQVTGELLPGGATIVDGYFCRLSPCRGGKRVFKTKRALIGHRRIIHSLPHKGTYKIPEDDQIRQWLHSGKPRPYEILHRSPECTIARDRPVGPPRPSLSSKLQHCKPDTESELQPASLESNIYEQFNVRHEPGEAGGSPYVGFVCLLSQCHEGKVCLNTYAKWTRHRRSVHKETEEVQRVKLPDSYEIRQWVNLNKPRPYEVPVRGRAWKKVKLCSVDPNVFAEFDVKGTVEDDEQLQFLCLLHPCKERGVSFQGRRCWRNHRVKHHMFPEYENGEYTLPSEEIIMDWMNTGKPPDYKPQRRVRTFVSVDSPSAKTSTELHNREVVPTPSNVVCNDVGNEVKSGGKESKKCRSGNQSLEGRPRLRSSTSLARLGMFRPSTSQDEILRESRRRGRRPRNADAAGCSSDTEHAHQEKKKRHSIHSPNHSQCTDSDSSDLVAVRAVAREEDPSGGLWKQFTEKTNPSRDETPPSDDSDEESNDFDEESDDGTEDVDEESDDGSENVDDLSVDQIVEDPSHDYNSAEVAEVDEDAHEEFEATDNVLPLQPELQNIKIEGQSSFQSQDFQGVTDKHQKNSTAEMVEFGEKAPEENVAVGNLSLSVQSESSEQLSVHYLRDTLQFSPEDSPGETDNHRPNSNAEMAEVGEEAPEGFVVPGNFVPWIPLMQSKGSKLPILEDSIDIQAAPIQESDPSVHMDQVFVLGPNDAGVAEVGEEAPEGFVTPENLAPWIPLMQLEVTKLPILEGPIDIQAAPIQESVPRVHVDISSMNELAVVVPFAPSTQSQGREIGSIFMEESSENSSENQADPFQELTTFIDVADVARAFESEPVLPQIDVRVENLEEFFSVEAVALSPQPMQQLFSPGNSEASNNFPVFSVLQIDPLIDMDSGLEYELSMLLQPEEIPAWLFD